MIRTSIVNKNYRKARPRVRPIARSETLDRQEAKRLLDEQARKYLGMSGDDFTARYRAATLHDVDTSRVSRVAALIPFTED